MEGQQIIRCDDVWFDDGTVVLQAENTLFKVYRGILEAQSPFFNDLFALPQRESEQSLEMYEDCPLVPMHDSAADVRIFLKAMMDHQFYSNVKSITDYNIVVSVIKLAHKYQVEYLLRRSIPAFTALYPPSLKNWDIRAGRRQYKPLAAVYGKALPIFVVQLARTTGIDVLLPAALFDCCHLSINEILCGVPAVDGTIICLDVRDQILVLQAREALSQRARTTTFSFVYSDRTLALAQVLRRSMSGTSVAAQGYHWRRVHAWLQGPQEGWVDPLSVEFPWEDFWWVTRKEGKQELEIKFRDARKAVWNELPLMFGLLSWDKMQRESLH